jgi:hypothetical protein
MLNSITLKPNCPEESICAFKLRHNVIARLLQNRCFAIKPFWNSKIDSQSEWPLVIGSQSKWPRVIDSQSEWPLARDSQSKLPLVIDSQSEWPLVIPPLTVFLGSGYIFLYSSLFTHKITFHLFTEEGRNNSKAAKTLLSKVDNR